jgi:HD-like signal output (HDOD) protein
MEQVEQLLQQAHNLPSLPNLHVRMLGILDEPDSDLRDLARMIGYDPSLSGRVMRLANSPLFGAGGSEPSLDTAVVRLGTSGIRHALLTSVVMTALPSSSAVFNAREFWALSVASALSARKIARDLRYARPEDAHLAGLVHCVGEAVLAVHFPERFERAVEEAQQDGCGLVETMWAEFGVIHPALCARVLEEWRFPRAIIEAVEYQLDPREAPNQFLLASIVLSADRIGRQLGIGAEDPSDVSHAWVEEIPEEIVQRLLDAGYPPLDVYIGIHQEVLSEIGELVAQLFSS